MGEHETFQTEIEKQLHQWQTLIENQSKAIDSLKRQAEQLEPDAKLQYLERIKELENKIETVKDKMIDAQQQLDTIKSAGEEAWEEVKTGSQHAWDDLALGFNKAWEEMTTSFDQASSKMQKRIPKE